MRQIAILGEFNASFPPHAATDAALEHSRAILGVEVEAAWVATDRIDALLFDRFSGVWIAPGSPYAHMDNVLGAIRYAREHRVPCFGTCGGFQHIVLEYARNVLGFQDAQHAEYDPYASELFVSQLDCSLAGREMQLRFEPSSQVAAIYGSLTTTERYYCNFGVDPRRVSALKTGPLRVSGSDDEGEVRVIEMPGHPFLIGTLFVPQARSTPTSPHPLVTGFLNAVIDESVRTRRRF